MIHHRGTEDPDSSINLSEPGDVGSDKNIYARVDITRCGVFSLLNETGSFTARRCLPMVKKGFPRDLCVPNERSEWAVK